MKKKWKLAAMLTLVAFITSCNDEKNMIEEVKYINISAEVGALTRVTNTAFEENDKISIYAWTGTSTEVGSLVVDNSINTYAGSVWLAETQMLWKDMVTPHFFIGIHPARKVVDFAADVLETPSDVLVATLLGEGQTPSNGNVPLTFNHIMARLDVNLQFRNQFDGTPTVTSVTTEALPGATINYLTQTATAAGTSQALILTATQANKAYSGVITPQQITKIHISIDGKTFTYTNPQSISLEKGKIQTVNLIVGRDQIELGSIVVNDWVTGAVIEDGEAQVE